MAQEGYDKLITLTDSRYRLSVVVGRRAAQLKSGIPSVLPREERPRGENSVTLAMKELELGAGVVWGDDLPTLAELSRAVEASKPEPLNSYAPTPLDEEE